MSTRVFVCHSRSIELFQIPMRGNETRESMDAGVVVMGFKSP